MLQKKPQGKTSNVSGNRPLPSGGPQNVRISDAPPAQQTADSEAAYTRFVPLAQALSAELVQTMREDPAICYHNLTLGVGAVLAHEAEVKKLPIALTLFELRALPELALALSFAASQVNRRSTGEVAALKAQAIQMRKLMLAAAEALAHSGDLPAREVEHIQRGRGPIDLAQDCVGLAALFKRNSALLTKTPLSSVEIDQASTVGTALLALLRPNGSRQPSRGAVLAQPSVEIRDRLWTLLMQRHRELRRIGMWLFMEEVDSFVPALRSRRAKAKTTPAAPPADPVPSLASSPRELS